jgi:hypothetical protein
MFCQIASNAKYIPRKSKKDLFNPDISFLVFRFYDILTFEYKFDRMHITITMLQIS